MKSMVPNSPWILIVLFCAAVNVLPALAQETAPAAQPAKPAQQITDIKIGYLRAYAPQLALSILDIPPPDEGIAGAKLGISDNNTTGSFMKQKYELDIAEIKPDADAVAAFNELAAKGDKYILIDLSTPQILSIVDLARDKGILLFNIGNPDDSLREADCRPNLFHIAPTRSMLADALAQYLIWKQWPRWVLIYGSHPGDQLFADALRRSATRFGGNILAEQEFKDTGTARRTDTGVVQIQQQIPVFTQNLPDHDVMLVADESEVFGTYIPYRTWLPRVVAGTAGLMASSWHPASEQWGGAQLQSRFDKSAGRHMLSKDMNAWTAVRSVGEAATRTNSGDQQKISDYLHSDKFEVAAFKGQKLTFRPWNLQLRQPIFLGDAKSVVSTSPQEGYLHQYSELDTLGVDQPETKCVFRK